MRRSGGPFVFLLIGVGALVLLTMGRRFMSQVKSLIGGEEGLRLTVYRDPGAGAWTIGWGHKVQPGEPYHPYGPIMTITREEADAIFEADTKIATDAVEHYVLVPLTDNQRAALISFVFNVGVGAFGASTLLRKLNAGDYAGAAGQFARWNQDDGVVLPILTARRARETDLFLA